MIKSFNVQDFVEKEVVKFGNGSIVFTPKKWIGKKVTVVLEEKPVDFRAEAMESLKPFLGSIEGVFLFGSFARNEQMPESDIDFLVISGKKIALKRKAHLDFLVKSRQEFIKELESDETLFLHQILREAKPILNESLLEELRQKKTEPKYGKLLDETLGAFKKTQELLNACKKQGIEFLDSNAVIYSLVLRIKGLVLAQCIAKEQKYSNKKLAWLLKSHGFTKKRAGDFIAIYRAERNGKKIPLKVMLAEAEKLFEAAKKEFIKTESLVKK